VLRKELASARPRRMKRKVEAKPARPAARGESSRGVSLSLRYVSDLPGVPLHCSKEQQADRATASAKADITTNEQRIRRAGHLGVGDTQEFAKSFSILKASDLFTICWQLRGKPQRPCLPWFAAARKSSSIPIVGLHYTSIPAQNNEAGRSSFGSLLQAPFCIDSRRIDVTPVRF
jgi:hypothetical protein